MHLDPLLFIPNMDTVGFNDLCQTITTQGLALGEQ